MTIFKKKNAKKPLVSDIDKEWAAYSYKRWKEFYGQFLYDIEVTDQSKESVYKSIQCAADAADEALRLEEERWTRGVMEGTEAR